MSDTTLIQTRSDAYTLLGQILCDGLTPESLPLVMPDGEMRFDADLLEAERYRVFGLNVYPYAGVFLGADGLMGGTEAEASAAFYARVKWDAPSHDADHIGMQLGVLAWLTGAEADALADGKPGQQARIQALRRDVLDRRVLTWLPMLARAVASQESRVYERVIGLALDLAAEDRAELGEGESRPAFVLPTPPDVLADPKTSLRDIASVLMTPAWAGVYLSREDVGRLARRHHLPSGFTDRKTLLHNVFRAAVDYGVFAALIADLCQTVTGWGDYFHQQANNPVLQAGCLVWARQTERTLDLLRHIESSSGYS